MRKKPLVSPIVLSLALAACGGGNDDSATGTNTSASPTTPSTQLAAFADRCSQLAGKTVGNGSIVSTALKAATATRAQTCEATGKIVSAASSTINFRVDLPVDSAWNQKLLQLGGGGFNGSVVTADGQPDITRRGYVTVGSDSGHTGSVVDLSFALNNATGFDNFAFNSVPQVYTAALDAIKLVYAAAPARKYFLGTSTGGREALQQAQRFPANYDGIVAQEPVLEYSSVIQKGTRVAQLAFNGGAAGWISPVKAKLIDTAQTSACDVMDGLVDGIIGNSAGCSFDPSVLRCPGGTDSGDTCLSDAQLATVTELRSRTTLPVALANGITTTPAFGIGAEGDASGGWNAMQLGGTATGGGGLLYAFSDNWIKYAITQNATASVLSYVLGSDAAAWMSASVKSNASNPNLSAFANRGGKLILWHGWSDQLVPPGFSIDYYNAVVSTLGQTATDGFMRFYMGPGVTHVGSGPGATTTDRLTALETWVEKGTAPSDALLATRYAADKVTVQFTRPECRYPAWPKYVGGDANAAASFKCVIG